jgi:glycosyltransferase involved in cell wall biosynthesis
LKILITVGIYPPDIGGPASFVPKIAEKLIENKFEVSVICLTEKKETDTTEYPVIRILRKQNLILRWVKTVSTIIKHGKNADIIFVNGLPMEAFVANILLRKKLVRKIVGDWAWERGRNKGIIDESFDEFQSNSHNFHLEIAKFSRGWTAAKANIVITPSIHLKKVVEKWGVNKSSIKVIYNGTLITENSKKKTQKDILNIITVGRLAPWKNIDVIIKSMSLIKQKGLQFHLYVIGSGPQENELKNLVKRLDLMEQVTFTGQKSTSELEKYYLKSDIYIQASAYEGLPHVLLEAINYNLFVISTPIGGSNEILENGNNGWVLNLENGIKPDEKEIKYLVYEILNNPKLANQKKQNSKFILEEKFNEEENFSKYLELFKE